MDMNYELKEIYKEALIMACKDIKSKIDRSGEAEFINYAFSNEMHLYYLGKAIKKIDEMVALNK